jgi:hypothetical protein
VVSNVVVLYADVLLDAAGRVRPERTNNHLTWGSKY